MKAIYTAIISASVAIQATEANDSYTNFIVQTDNVPAGEVDPPSTTFPNVDSEGTMTAAPVGPDGSSFELFTINNDTNEVTQVAENAVSSYLPSASIEILTLDPYNNGGVRRTRANDPFIVKRTVQGLYVANDEGEVEEAALAVNYQHSLIPENSQSTVLETVSLDANKTDELGKEAVVSVPTTTVGVENFTIYTNVGFGQNGPRELANATIRVFPEPKATISGHDTEEVYNRLPDIKLEYNDLYPGSETWLRFTHKETGAVIEATKHTFKGWNEAEDAPGEANYLASNLDEVVTEPGEYTMEVIHKISFMEEYPIATSEITKKDTIVINANIGGSE